jgi:histidinol dehydrogenase
MRIYSDPGAYFQDRQIEGSSREVADRTAAILERVRREGDAALLELARELDATSLRREDLRVSREELARSASRAPAGFEDVLSRAADNIRRYHEREIEGGFHIAEGDGTRLGLRVRPLESVGVYVPGGAASYPSTVLMNVIPAQVAGVARIVAVTPPGALERSNELAAALSLLNVEEIYRVGGAQAVAALAYGTETIRRVVKIVGPGNAYVAEAKRLVFGEVGIDALAGPSEIVVLADDEADPRYVAADLLSQAEHGSGDERSILVTPSRGLAEEVKAEIERQSRLLSRREAVAKVLARHGAVIVTASLEQAIEVVDRIAPEHVEVLTRDAEAVAERISNAGALFLGPWSPVPVGDFYAGPNHVLPTSGAARFSSLLGVWDFTKRTSVVRYSRERLERDRSDIEAFARAEGFEAHARAVAIRFAEDSLSARSAPGRPPAAASLRAEASARAKSEGALKEEAAAPKAQGRGNPAVLPERGARGASEPERRASIDIVRPAVKALRAYHLDRRDVAVKLDQNENNLGVPLSMMEELLEALREAPLHRYPSPSQTEILETLSVMSDWPKEGILAGNGSDELLHSFALSFLEPGRKALVPTPSFFVFAYTTRLMGAEVVEVPLRDMKYDVDAILSAIEEHQPAVVYLCSPNNPTGSALEPEDVASIAANAPGVVALDEAYWEFSGGNARRLLDPHRNLILFRTFSKALALAGLRLGYLLAAPELAVEIKKTQQAYPLSRVAIEAARIASRHRDLLRERALAIVRERDRLYQRMSSMRGLQVFPSKGNFLLFRTRLGAKKTFEALLARGLLVRDVSGHPLLEEMLRVAIGTPSENQELERALNEILEDEP